MTKIFVVEDHQIVRKTLISLLEREPDFTVSGEAASGEEALMLLPEIEVDLILVDISMPGMDGISLLREVKKRWPNLACLVLSGHAESVYGKQARSAGALGYVDKREVREIVPTIRRVLGEAGSSNGSGSQ